MINKHIELLTSLFNSNYEKNRLKDPALYNALEKLTDIEEIIKTEEYGQRKEDSLLTSELNSTIIQEIVNCLKKTTSLSEIEKERYNNVIVEMGQTYFQFKVIWKPLIDKIKEKKLTQKLNLYQKITPGI